jgi:hypothetical protein
MTKRNETTQVRCRPSNSSNRWNGRSDSNSIDTGGQFLRASPVFALLDGAAVESEGLDIGKASTSSSFAEDLSSRMEESLPRVVLPSV